MPGSSIRVEAFQASPAPRNIEKNIEHVQRAVRGSRGDLVVFPELFLTGYQTHDLEELALLVTDSRLAPLVQSCVDSRKALLVGFVEGNATGYYNSYLAIDQDGRVLPPIRKTHLFGSESEAFLPGDAFKPVTLCGTLLGVVNCFEVEFPEVARTLALRGATVLVVGSANMHPYVDDHRIATVARALENRLPLVYANRIGSESGHDFCGCSRIIDRNGHVLSELDRDQAASLVGDFPLNEALPNEVDMLAQRRPLLYEP